MEQRHHWLVEECVRWSLPCYVIKKEENSAPNEYQQVAHEVPLFCLDWSEKCAILLIENRVHSNERGLLDQPFWAAFQDRVEEGGERWDAIVPVPSDDLIEDGEIRRGRLGLDSLDGPNWELAKYLIANRIFEEGLDIVLYDLEPLGEDIAFPILLDDEPSPFQELTHFSWPPIAKGGDLSPERLIHAYKCGIFFWETEPEIAWFAPTKRMVLLTSELHVGATMRRVLARSSLEITFDRAFENVVRNCAVTAMNNSRRMGTWIIDGIVESFLRLHEQGFAHSCEAWKDGELVGGIYGVSLGGAFFAESMFNSEDNAGKVAFVHLVRTLDKWGIELFDCQVRSVWTERFGASLWPRSKFQSHLKEALKVQTRIGSWDNKSE